MNQEQPLLKIVPAGIDIAVWEWPGKDPPLCFAHATGFHGRCWDRIARDFPGRRRLAIDFRGHGRSQKPAPPYHWPAFARDLAALADRLQFAGATGIGHSMGGHTMVAAAIERPHAFARLLLIDPTIFPPEYYTAAAFDASFIRRRRAVWSSPEEMFQRFRTRAPFAGWEPDILRDYCDYGLLPANGGYVLACPPDIEASIYEHSRAPESDIYPGISSVRARVTVVRAGIPFEPGVLNLSASPTASGLASRFPHGRDILLPGQNHFIPMELPGLVSAEIRRLEAGQSGSGAAVE